MSLRLLLLLLVGVVAAGSACTSSSTTTSTATNTGYDQQYRNATTGAQQTYEQKPADATDGDPAITIMQLGMETGDVYPGEEYFVHAVVDNPMDRELEYVWSVTSGEMSEVPEAERGRMQTFVETKYGTIVTPEMEAAATAAATGAADTAAGDPAVPNTPPGSDTVQPGENRSGGGTPTTGGSPNPNPNPNPNTNQNQNPNINSNDNSGLTIDTVAMPTEAEANALLAKQAGGEQLTREEQLKIERWFRDRPQPDDAGVPNKDGSAAGSDNKRMTRLPDGRIIETRIVAAPGDPEYMEQQLDDEEPEPDDETADSIADAAASLREETDETTDDAELSGLQTPDEMRERANPLAHAEDEEERDEPYGAENVVEGGIAGDPYEVEDPYFERGWEDGVRTIDEVDAERPYGQGEDYRRTEYAEDYYGEDEGAYVYGDEEVIETEADEITAEDAYAANTLVTSEPFIRWVPTRPGETKIFVKARWKTDDLTEPTELPVTVRLREPVVRLSDEFPDMVREDDSVYLRLESENMPDFSKGLFTVSFDPDVLSFREAELGEFFDSAPDASLIYAQPDKLAGKVLFAIDSNTEMARLQGDGPLVYARFTAKQDIDNRDMTNLALVQDGASQYVLDGAGDNILPLAVDHPVYASALVVPPRYEQYARVNTPGGGVPEGAAEVLGEEGLASATGQPAAADTAAVAADGTPAAAGQPPATVTTNQQQRTSTPVTNGGAPATNGGAPVGPSAPNAGSTGQPNANPNPNPNPNPQPPPSNDGTLKPSPTVGG